MNSQLLVRPIAVPVFLLSLVLGAALALPAVAGESERPADFSGWYSDMQGLRDAIAEQKKTQKPMLVYFYTDWCGYCAQFERVLLNEQPVIDYLDSIITVRVNPEHGMAEREVANMYGVRGFPVLVMHSARSKTMSRVSRHTEKDGKPRLLEAEDFVRELEAAASL